MGQVAAHGAEALRMDPLITLLGVDVLQFAISLVIFFALYLAISISLNLEFGYTGIPNFGKVMFVAGGAAIAGTFSGRFAALLYRIDTHGNYVYFNPQIISQADALLAQDPLTAVLILLLSILLAGLVAAVMGYLASYPAIRLREDYLGMLLLGAAQFFQVFLSGYDPLVGGTQGMLVPDLFIWLTPRFGNNRDLVSMSILSLFALMVYLYAERLARSPLGRTLRAVRDNEVASMALGKDIVALRRKALVSASAISGMAGAIFTFYAGSVGAYTWNRFSWTFLPWTMVIIGGAANNAGVALGVLLYWLLSKLLEQLKFSLAAYVPVDINWVTYLAFSSLLVLILLYRPEGLIREKPTATLPLPIVQKIRRAASSRSTAATNGSKPSEKEGTQAGR
jgi:branched-chain amino acid transport system permease protein